MRSRWRWRAYFWWPGFLGRQFEMRVARMLTRRPVGEPSGWPRPAQFHLLYGGRVSSPADIVGAMRKCIGQIGLRGRHPESYQDVDRTARAHPWSI